MIWGKEHVNISIECQAFKWQGQYLLVNCMNIRPYSCLGKQNPKNQL